MATEDLVNKVVEHQVLNVAKVIENQLDEEIIKLESLDDDDLEKLREQRLQQLKSMAVKKQQWLSHGHGEYQEIFSEKDFFAVAKASERVVCHFYRENWPCKVIDKHLNILVKEHLETRFVKIQAEKSPFLTEKLKIFMLPTLALIRKGKVEDYVVGFDELGGNDEFSTEDLKDRLSKSGVIVLDGDISSSRVKISKSKRGVRQTVTCDSDSD